MTHHSPRFGLPAWLACRPQYHWAAWLWWRGAARGWPVLCLATLVLWALVGVLLGRWSMFAAGLRTLGAPASVAVFASLMFVVALRLSVRRRHGLHHQALRGVRSWAASLPSSVCVAERIAFVPLLLGVALGVMLGVGAALQGSRWAWAAVALPVAVLAGAAAGVAWAPLVPQRAALPERRTVWLNRPLASHRASLLPLGHWPDGRKQRWSRPHVLARGTFWIWMGLPMMQSQGGFARTALGLVALWFVGHHLVSLLLALIATAPPAARWLAPLPLAGRPFAVFLGLRMFIKEVLAAFLLACGVMVVEPRLQPGMAVLVVLAWSAACLALGAGACLLARRPRVLISPLHRWLRE